MLSSKIATFSAVFWQWCISLSSYKCPCLIDRTNFPGCNFSHWERNKKMPHSQRNCFGILLNLLEIWLYLAFCDWFGTKRTSVWFQINLKMLNTIWFRVDLIRFRNNFSVCRSLSQKRRAWTSHWHPRKLHLSCSVLTRMCFAILFKVPVFNWSEIGFFRPIFEVAFFPMAKNDKK